MPVTVEVLEMNEELVLACLNIVWPVGPGHAPPSHADLYDIADRFGILYDGIVSAVRYAHETVHADKGEE